MNKNGIIILAIIISGIIILVLLIHLYYNTVLVAKQLKLTHVAKVGFPFAFI